MRDGNIILSVAKAMELLQILSRAGRPLSLKELTDLCGYPKSTVFGLLTTMRLHDVVTQTPEGKYTLGLRLFEYGRQVERSWDISRVARPYMEHLCRQTVWCRTPAPACPSTVPRRARCFWRTCPAPPPKLCCGDRS